MPGNVAISKKRMNEPLRVERRFPYFHPPKMRLAFAVMLAIFTGTACSQSNHQHGFEYWGAYISSLQVSEKYALWNDFHFVNHAFLLSRHGITRNLGKGLSLSGGYAWVRTSTSFSNRLIRQEHRPWFQLEWTTPLSPKNSYRLRFRYDNRFRQRISGTELADDFILQNRLRLMNSIRLMAKDLGAGKSLHINIMNETLLQFGQGIDGLRLDQNRSYLLGGISIPHTTILGGYHVRILPGAGATRFQHGITMWVVQRFDLRRKTAGPDKLHGNPGMYNEGI